MKHRIAALLFDLGDTLMIEESEIKDAEGTTLRADLIPGMADVLQRFKAQGHTIALVADSRPETPPNVLRQHELYGLFDYLAISEVVGASKPEPLIFRIALDALGIPESEYHRVVMVGNNLERDIVGANRLGLISVFFYWSHSRRGVPLTGEEEPDYRVTSAEELMTLIDDLESRI
jgi:HAD superfamily hydrolase (TIGR01549 family)